MRFAQRTFRANIRDVGRVQWAEKWTKKEIERGRTKDVINKKAYYENLSQPEDPDSGSESSCGNSLIGKQRFGGVCHFDLTVVLQN